MWCPLKKNEINSDRATPERFDSKQHDWRKRTDMIEKWHNQWNTIFFGRFNAYTQRYSECTDLTVHNNTHGIDANAICDSWTNVIVVVVVGRFIVRSQLFAKRVLTRSISSLLSLDNLWMDIHHTSYKVISNECSFHEHEHTHAFNHSHAKCTHSAAFVYKCRCE